MPPLLFGDITEYLLDTVVCRVFLDRLQRSHDGIALPTHRAASTSSHHIGS